MAKELEVHVARLEERMIAVDQKIDRHAEQSSAQFTQMSDQISNFGNKILAKEKAQDDDISENKEKITELRRDRAWVIGIWGFVQLALIAYIKYRPVV